MRRQVTGGAGFLGSNLVRTLLQRGDDVVSLDREPFDYPERPRIREIRGDIRNRGDVTRTAADCDVIVHAAAALLLYPPVETDPRSGGGPYGIAKVEAERVGERAREHGRTVSVLRPKSCVGPERLG